MNEAQRVHLMADLWPPAAKAQGWKVSDRAKRMEVLSRIVGRPLASANEIDERHEFTKVKRELLRLADRLEGPLDTDEEERARKIRSVIRDELLPCLGLYVGLNEGDEPRDLPDVGAALRYMHAIIQDKFNRTRRYATLDLDDLTARPIVIRVKGELREIPSQLDQLVMTLTARLNSKRGLRNQFGHSLHQMKTLAGVKCDCSICKPISPRAQATAAALMALSEEEMAAANQPF